MKTVPTQLSAVRKEPFGDDALSEQIFYVQKPSLTLTIWPPRGHDYRLLMAGLDSCAAAPLSAHRSSVKSLIHCPVLSGLVLDMIVFRMYPRQLVSPSTYE